MLRRNKIRISAFILVTTVLLSFQNCAYGPGSGAIFNSGTGEVAELTEGQVLEKQAVSILTSNCAGCHNASDAQGGFSGVDDPDVLKYFRYVIPGEAQISPLYEQIATAECPPSRPLPQAQARIIFDWINVGLSNTLPPGSIPGSEPLTDTWSSIRAKIIGPRCINCHNTPTNNNRNVGLSTYQLAVASGVFVANNPDGSRLYTSVVSGNMPRQGGRLSPMEVETIRSWIAKGAQNN